MKYIINIIRLLFLGLFLYLMANGKAALWLILFLASLVLALFFGRLFCGYVCLMNTLMIPTEWISKKLKFQTRNTPRILKSGYYPWISLALSIVLIIISRRVLNIDFPLLPIWIILSILVTLRYRPEVFHNLICPFGALQNLLGRFARFSETVDQDACIGCKLCEKVCPSTAVVVSTEDKKATINRSLCLQCTNCRQICPTKAISYGKYAN